MRVMTYNIYDGAVESLDLVIKAVQGANPDVLVLNEANGFQNDDFKKLRVLAAQVGLPFSHLELCGDGAEYHVAVLARYPFKSVQALHPFLRAAILVVISTSIGDVALVGTHLSPRYEAARMEELQVILEALSAYENQLILGDLNSLSADDTYPLDLFDHLNDGQRRKFTEGGRVVFRVLQSLKDAGFIDTAARFSKQHSTTVPTPVSTDLEHSNLRLDYVLSRGPIADRVVSYEVVKDVITDKASDHYPVIADFDIDLLQK